MLLSTILVTNTSDGEAGSLRAAILMADDPASGVDTIDFAITGTGAQTIAPLSALPTITRPITINGYSQPGASPNTLAVGDDAVLTIVLDGASAGNVPIGLTIAGGGTTVRGLVISRFNGEGIDLSGPGGDTIAGDFLGTDAAGTTGLGGGGNYAEITVAGPNQTIGGLAAADRNIIAASSFRGILLSGGTGSRLLNNYIGTDKTGAAALGGSGDAAVYIQGATGVTLGGTTAAERNVISGNRSDGIVVQTSGNVIEGNDIGTTAAGNAALQNGGSGIVLNNGGSTIGGTAPGAGNLISGNAQAGINIHFSAPTAPGNVVLGNLIGTDATGKVKIPNQGAGVDIGNGGGGGFNNTIGGTTPAARNVVSGNAGNGINSSGTGSANVIVGNYVGVDVTGLAPLSNGGEGVVAYGSSNITIGGTAAGAGNVISANALDGVLVFSPSVVVQGNLIGLGADGITPLGNGVAGIITYYDTSIGGTTAAARNVISANGAGGIDIRGGTGAAVVQGNFIGTDASGMLARGNMGFGVLLNDVPGTPSTIGGSGAGDGNVISANGASNAVTGEGVVPGGVELIARGGNLVQGNLIGLAADGTSPLGNRGSGVALVGNATNNTIRLNTIAFNGADVAARSAGVSVIGLFSSGNRLDANSIYQNTGLGIDLGDDGVTANTPGGPHPGPNALQNFPVITSVSTTTTDTVVAGTLNGAAMTIFTVQFFANAAADPSGFGQGQTFLGEVTDLTTNADGFASFTVSLRTVIAPGQLVTATATDPAGNTSEFSGSAMLPASDPLVVTTALDDGPGSLRAAITYANANPGLDAITFKIPIAGIQTITPLSALPTITDPVVIDGYSQPGAKANDLAQGDDAIPLIEIDGANAGGSFPGLEITAGGSTVRGLVIDGFAVGAGIRLDDNGGDTIAGDFLGMEFGGDGQMFATPLARGNRVGIQVDSPQNTIGGTSPADRNVVSANTYAEVYLTGVGATDNLVEGNYVGTTPDGAASLSNPGGGDGVDIDNGASSNTVGGTSAVARNLISGNGRSGVRIAEAATNQNVVDGNFIGTDVTGAKPLGNTFHGVLIHRGAQGNIIGGTVPGAANVIAANSLHGVAIADASTSGNLIEGDFIGTDTSATANLGNGDQGVSIAFNAFNNTVGGTVSGGGNTIAFNAMNGVTVEVGNGTGNAILSNAIFGNHLLGIDLGNDGVTPNTSPTAPHVGPNMLQSFPVLSSVTSSGQNLVISGTLVGIAQNPLVAAPPTVDRVEFFANAVADPSGFGQGRRSLGSVMVTLDAQGKASFVATLPAGTLENPFVTATATDPNGNTSEFSASVPLASAADLSLSGAASTTATTVGSLATYTLTAANLGPGPASGVTLADALPSGVAFVSATSSQGTAIQSGGVVSANLGSLASGASATITILVMLTTVGTSVDVASVGAITSDPNPANNSTSVAIAANLRTTTDLTAKVDGSAIVLRWAPTPGATAYKVYRSTSSGSETLYQAAVSAAIVGGASVYRDGQAQAGVTYDYEITAVAGTTESARSNEASAGLPPAPPPPAPTAPIHVYASLLDTGGGTFAPLITWGYSDPTGTARFRVDRSSGSGGEVEITAPAGVPVHDLIDPTARAGLAYTYRVTAVSSGVESPQSAPASVTVPAVVGSHPILLKQRALLHQTSRTPASPRGPFTHWRNHGHRARSIK